MSDKYILFKQQLESYLDEKSLELKLSDVELNEYIEKFTHQFNTSTLVKPTTYAEAGVDRKKEENAVNEILKIIKSTYTTDSILPEGHYANGIFYENKILLLATDGVGSKVILAKELNKYDTIGIDCVAMNVNDLIVTGGVPLAFVDYIALRYPDSKLLAEIAKGLAEGCIQSEIPLVGGETSIMPEVIAGPGNGYDVAGTALGVIEHGKEITGKNIRAEDVLIGIESSGIHSNGLTLARKLFDEVEWKEILLIPTRIYVKAIKELLLQSIPINGMAHITGGGFTNLSRLGDFHYKLNSWNIPELFLEIEKRGAITKREMFRTFNMGIGYTVIVSPEHVEDTLKVLNRYFPAKQIGLVEVGSQVSIDGVDLL
jgi:phosphoribosylformylglycinamidine cyclo-ligase